MIELHWVFIAAYLLVDYGFWLWRGHLHRKAKRLLKEEADSLGRKASLAQYQMVGAWHALFIIRDYAATGRRPSAAALTKHIDELTDRHWKDREAARDLIAKRAAEYAEANPR